MKKGFKIIGKRKKKEKEEDNNNKRPDGSKDIDSDYEDSHRLGIDEEFNIEVYVDTEDDETDQNVGNPNSYDTGVAVISPTEGPSTPQQFSPEPAPVVVPSEEQVEKTILSDEERKARARKAVQERKNKSRLDIAARKAKADGKTTPPSVVSPDVTVPLAGENAIANANAVTPNNNNEEERRRAVSEERQKLLELERRQEEEEREQLEKEETEMKELEEALKKEEEEAKKLAEQYDDVIKETVVVETVDTDELKEEEEAGKTKLEAEFKELAKRELEAERIRAEELAKLQAEVEENARKREAEKKAEDLLNQFVTLEEEQNNVDFVGDVNHHDSAQLPDLDDLLDGSLSYNESTILDDAIDGPIVFTEPASKPNDKKKETKVAAPKPKSSSTKPGPKSNVRKPPGSVSVSKKPEKKSPMSRYLKPVPVLPRVSKKPDKKPSVTKSPKPWRSVIKKPDKKPPVSKPLKPVPTRVSKKPPASTPLKPVTSSISKKPLVSKALNPVQPSISNMSHLRRQKNPTNSKSPPVKESPSMDSMGSHCTFNSIPRSPYGKPPPDMLMCKNQFIVKMHVKPMGCQVCIFKLSETEKDEYEKNGRHLRVATTFGGCSDCAIFPSAVEEDPVRLCKKCFFDTHLVRKKEDEAFMGSGALTGVQRDHATYNPSMHRYMGGR